MCLCLCVHVCLAGPGLLSQRKTEEDRAPGCSLPDLETRPSPDSNLLPNRTSIDLQGSGCSCITHSSITTTNKAERKPTKRGRNNRIHEAAANFLFTQNSWCLLVCAPPRKGCSRRLSEQDLTAEVRRPQEENKLCILSVQMRNYDRETEVL